MSEFYEVVRSSLHYCPDSGEFTRAGLAAGGQDGLGYVRIRVDGNKYKAHRLAWLYVFGEWPVGMIDHINGIRSDNRLCNLRDVGRAANIQNQRRPRSDNTSGYLGVSLHRSGKWKASIQANGKYVYLGLFVSKEDARDAYVQAKRKLHISQ